MRERTLVFKSCNAVWAKPPLFLCVRNNTTSHDCYSLTVPAYVKKNTRFPVPGSLRPPQIPHVPALHQILTPVARSQVLTAPATTRPIMNFITAYSWKSRKVPVCFTMSVCPSVRTYYLDHCWRTFSWNLLAENFTKVCWVLFLPTTRNLVRSL